MVPAQDGNARARARARERERERERENIYNKYNIYNIYITQHEIAMAYYIADEPAPDEHATELIHHVFHCIS